MKVSLLENTSIQTPAAQLARLSGPHGYRFDGDTVQINAMFALLDPVAHERSWALQLWACPTAPESARELAGHIVAEIALPPMGELADEIEHFEVSAFSLPPAGPGEHVMVLVLASGRTGQFNDIHDLAVYSRRQEFVQPRMGGNVGYRVDGSRVQIQAGRVENPRVAGSSSGTLSLELWALPAPFTGGRFQGHHLAGVEIGSIDGQYELVLQPIDLAFTPPPAGAWQIVLMLREWTSSGFVTRDFANFPQSFVSAPVVEKSPAPAPTPVVAKPATVDAPKASAPTPAPTPAPSPAPAKALANGAAKGVSVNSARVEELAAIQGLTRKLAEAIVKKRPFVSLDGLREVKGLGEKTLVKIRSSLRL